jgi:hypothetical protein
MTKRRLRLSLVAATVLMLPGVSPAAGQSEAPVESQAPIDPMAASFWTATYSHAGGGPGAGTTGPIYFEELGVTGSGEVAADDPRISGTIREIWNAREFTRPGGFPVTVANGAARIDNDQGAWVGTFTTYGARPEGGGGWYVLEGEGAYEGLTALFHWPFGVDSFQGAIVPGELPSPADPIAPPTE